MSPPPGRCAPLPGASAHVSRGSGLRDHCPPSTPRQPGKWGAGRGGRRPRRARRAATFPSNGCDDAFNSLRAGPPRTCRGLGRAARRRRGAGRSFRLRLLSAEQKHLIFSPPMRFFPPWIGCLLVGWLGAEEDTAPAGPRGSGAGGRSCRREEEVGAH